MNRLGALFVGVAGLLGFLVGTTALYAGGDLLANQLVIEEQQFAPGSFEDPDICLDCHADIHDQWAHSMHAYAWENSWYQDDYRMAHAETGGATDVLCGACHAPIAARTGQLPPHDGSAFDATARRGISCDFCHTITAVEKTYNMGNISEPGAMKYGPRGDGESPYHGVVHSPLHRSAEFCGACHNVRNPVNDVRIIDTYDDWKAGPYADQGIVCQDCHMTPTAGVAKNPGMSSPMGREREHVAMHNFVGGSVFSQRLRGNHAQADLAEEMLKGAARLSLESTLDDNRLALTVHVDNVGAGHKIPTGVTYFRKMWLEVHVRDDQGHSVYSSGMVDDNNHVDPDAVFYRLLFRDSEGNLTGKSWRGVDIGYDRRIPAQGRDSETFAIELPANTTYQVDVRLMYRSFSQETLDFHRGDQAPKIDSIEMARASLAVQR